MSRVQGRSSERNDSIDTGADGPTLKDCHTLIARIDGTMKALMRERAALEQRASSLSESEPGTAQHER